MSLILGLDLGSGSIGWAVIEYADTHGNMTIYDLGSRTIPIDGETLSKFDTGQSITINSSRTAKRTMRKTLNRYQDRKKALTAWLSAKGMLPQESEASLSREALWELRAKGATEKLGLEEIGRVLLHLIQKRGYNASRSDLASNDKNAQGYLSDIRNRYQELCASGKTIGQYYYEKLKADPEFRIKGQVMPRQAYIDEYDAIIECQRKHYPDLFNEKDVQTLRNNIMYYQRPLKSCKHLVNVCEFEAKTIVKDGKEITVGPKVAHKSNPLFQLSRLLQVANGLKLTDRYDPKQTYELSKSERDRILGHLMTKDKLKVTDIYGLLFNKKNQRRWIAPDNVGNGIPGNRTLLAISKALGGKYEHLIKLDLNVVEDVNDATGEVTRRLAAGIENQPLYRLWHVLYSIKDVESLRKVLADKFGIDADTIENLVKIDFSNDGYGNMSEKAIKRILPYLLSGEVYSQACASAGFKHSDSLTTEENATRRLLAQLPSLKKGELRQPIVEKVLNQMVNLVNALMSRYGEFDEIHIELARSLKQGREERSETTTQIRKIEKINEKTATRIKEEYGLTPNKTRINKLKLWEESSHLCIYCNQPVSANEFLQGYDVEVEHIVPKSLLFDDSYSNKACACRKCNQAKGKMTAFDYMSSLGETTLNDYVARVRKMAEEKKISNTKRDRLLMSSDEIPADFIERQLRESQYIARQAKKMLESVCRTVVSTSGSITDYLRHIWGWDQVLHDLNIDRYAKADLVEISPNDPNGKTLRIKGWSKRCDHRHHAIDALTIACTNRSIIQRLNNLNSLKDEKFEPFDKQSSEHKTKQSQLEKYANSIPHFSYEEVKKAAAEILVSLKQSLKFVSSGKRYTYANQRRKCVQSGINIPRGPLHEETIMGKILRYDASGNLYDAFVVKYPITSIKSLKDAASIVDGHIRKLAEERLKSVKDAASAFVEPLYSDKAKTKQIKSVRCFTGATVVLPVRRDATGKEIGFAKPGVNHHVAIYEDTDGILHENISSFKHCIDRKLYGFAPIIQDPNEVWTEILNNDKTYPESFLEQLPKDGWKLKYSIQRNELFVLGLSKEEVDSAIARNDKALLNQHLYRVQKLSAHDYSFTLHTQTQSSPSEFNKPDCRFVRIRSLKSLKEWNPIKIKIGILGEIIPEGS